MNISCRKSAEFVAHIIYRKHYQLLIHAIKWRAFIIFFRFSHSNELILPNIPGTSSLPFPSFHPAIAMFWTLLQESDDWIEEFHSLMASRTFQFAVSIWWPPPPLLLLNWSWYFFFYFPSKHSTSVRREKKKKRGLLKIFTANRFKVSASVTLAKVFGWSHAAGGGGEASKALSSLFG